MLPYVHVYVVILRWLGTIHVWLHHKNQNACFGKSTTNRLHKGVSIYKAFVNLSSPANNSVQLWVKHELEIERVRKSTKHIPSSMTLNFWLCTI